MEQEASWLCSDCYNWVLSSADRTSSYGFKGQRLKSFSTLQLLD